MWLFKSIFSKNMMFCFWVFCFCLSMNCCTTKKKAHWCCWDSRHRQTHIVIAAAKDACVKKNHRPDTAATFAIMFTDYYYYLVFDRCFGDKFVSVEDDRLGCLWSFRNMQNLDCSMNAYYIRELSTYVKKKKGKDRYHMIRTGCVLRANIHW